MEDIPIASLTVLYLHAGQRQVIRSGSWPVDGAGGSQTTVSARICGSVRLAYSPGFPIAAIDNNHGQGWSRMGHGWDCDLLVGAAG